MKESVKVDNIAQIGAHHVLGEHSTINVSDCSQYGKVEATFYRSSLVSIERAVANCICDLNLHLNDIAHIYSYRQDLESALKTMKSSGLLPRLERSSVTCIVINSYELYHKSLTHRQPQDMIKQTDYPQLQVIKL